MEKSVKSKVAEAPDALETVRVVLADARTMSLLAETAMLFRRGPFSGPGFQPTADMRFRRAERLRADVPLAAPVDSVTARLLDRNGQPLSIPVVVAPREDGRLRVASSEIVLAPLANGDYLVEVSAVKDGKTVKAVVAFRVVP
jgi:hypothetical protein